MAYHRILVVSRTFGKGAQKEELYSLCNTYSLEPTILSLEDAANPILDEWIRLAFMH
jgi:hypothetical protein